MFGPRSHLKFLRTRTANIHTVSLLYTSSPRYIGLHSKKKEKQTNRGKTEFLFPSVSNCLSCGGLPLDRHLVAFHLHLSAPGRVRNNASMSATAAFQLAICPSLFFYPRPLFFVYQRIQLFILTGTRAVMENK